MSARRRLRQRSEPIGLPRWLDEERQDDTMGDFISDADDKRVLDELTAALGAWWRARVVALDELRRIDDAVIEKVRAVLVANPRVTNETFTVAFGILRCATLGVFPRVVVRERPREP
jgi:hypothetical protein